MKTKENKSLCESCSNRVVIKFHGKKIRSGVSEGNCFYNFTVMTSDSRYKENTNGSDPYETLVAHIIVDECSFYNKSINRFNKPIIDKKDDDSDDYGTDSEGNRMHGVTFKNIPGALLP